MVEGDGIFCSNACKLWHYGWRMAPTSQSNEVVILWRWSRTPRSLQCGECRVVSGSQVHIWSSKSLERKNMKKIWKQIPDQHKMAKNQTSSQLEAIDIKKMLAFEMVWWPHIGGWMWSLAMAGLKLGNTTNSRGLWVKNYLIALIL